MWVRKSKQQIAKDRRRWLSFRGPLIWFVVMFLLGTAKGLMGPTRSVTHWPSTWGQLLASSAVFAAFVALAVYVLQIISKKQVRFLDDEVSIVFCGTCHRVKRRDNQNTCECGGKFEEFDNWTWIEDGKTDPC